MMKRLILALIILSIAKPSFAQGLPFGTPRVLRLIYCINKMVAIWIQPPASFLPSGPWCVPMGTNRYMYFIYPPGPGTKMLGWWVPGGVCLIHRHMHTIPIPCVGTITGYGSAPGF
jgi:hypothetical protein